MGSWTLETIVVGSVRRVESRSGDPAQHQGRGPGGAERRRLRHLSRPRLRRRSRLHGRGRHLGRAKRSSTAWRSAAGRSSPIRPGISTPPSRASAPATSCRSMPRLGARQPGRRDDGALHRRDRHQLLLQRAQGRDRRAGAEAGLRQDRGRRVPPLQAFLRRICAAAWSAIGSAAGAGCASAGAASPRARTTSSPMPISRPTSPTTRSTTASAACRPMPAAPIRSTARPTCSAPWPWC